MIPAKSGPATTDARPAAAAAASRWPMFDFREVHTVGARIARLAAPTCEETHSPKEEKPLQERGSHLDGIPERRARAVRFQRRTPVARHGLEQPLLRRPVRRRQARARAVLLYGRPKNARAICTCFHDVRAAPLAAAVPVRPPVERVASPKG